MKVRALFTLLLVLSVGATHAAAGARFAERQRLTPEEEREAREFVEALVGRLEREQDFGALRGEMFVGDFAEQLQAAAVEDGLYPFLDRSVAAEARREEILRYHVASSNLLLLTSLYTTDARLAARDGARGGARATEEPELKDVLPPDVLELFRADPFFRGLVGEEGAGGAAARGAADDAVRKDTITTAEQLRSFTSTAERAVELLRKGLTGEQKKRAFDDWRRAFADKDDETNGPSATVVGGDWYGRPAGTRIVCFGLLLLHVELVKVGDGFKVLAMYLAAD